VRERIHLEIPVAQDVTQNQPESSQRCNRDGAAKSELGSVNEEVTAEKKRVVTRFPARRPIPEACRSVGK
jgi:hypothetical protein